MALSGCESSTVFFIPHICHQGQSSLLPDIVPFCLQPQLLQSRLPTSSAWISLPVPSSLISRLLSAPPWPSTPQPQWCQHLAHVPWGSRLSQRLHLCLKAHTAAHSAAPLEDHSAGEVPMPHPAQNSLQRPMEVVYKYASSLPLRGITLKEDFRLAPRVPQQD